MLPDNINKKSVHLICWLIGLAGLIIPVIIKYLYVSTFGWTISLLFPFMILYMYKKWIYGISALLLITIIKYIVEFRISRELFHEHFLEFTLNSISNCVLFFIIAIFFLRYVEVSRRLLESEERYRKVLEFSPKGIIVHKFGEVLYANRKALEIVKVNDFKGTNLLNFLHPDDRELSKERILTGMTGEELPVIETKLIQGDSNVIDIEVVTVSVKLEGIPVYLTMFQDITERKKFECNLAESEARYRLITENMNDLICIISEDGTFKYASPSHVTVLGFPSEAYEGKLARDWMHHDDLENVRKNLKEIMETKEERIFHFRFKNIKGQWIWLEGKGTPIYDTNGTFKHYLVVSREITERKMYEDKLKHMAYHDTLTGLPNRRFFNDSLEQSLKEAIKYERKMAVLFMDLDKFKEINDNLGHHIGDELLMQFSQRIKKCLRDSDIIGRQGGDEFLILLPEIYEESDAIQIALRILSSFQEPWQIKKHIFYTTSSIGISYFPKNGTTIHQLLKSADIALYQAKESGRNNIKIAE